ncbi:helix-turn-helix domain-containing protein [Pseudomonas stutzeri]|uniref:helix-turn-helix domain-containing protein n=1 Tax=Stutzerimonas stutzeri TaxID=316 RepID=UPI001F3CD08D|nr:helix-turn-helix transcriptional regulator [Stutzerimonas stutzeri]MCF0017451.1 helix-turn-helix domain-containing protein [Stutzerimonas stutzeri]MCF0021925.1 helix-turn-helix domain-containing protein [Stutzerimonas stutzeri]MDH1590440.1 helix-turn-helix domain-containing protein [Stutzerimonas stutzeri]
MELNVAFGLALKQLRKSNGKTQEDFAVVSSRTYLSTLERGKKSPTIDKVEDLSVLLGIQPLTLLTATYLLKNDMSLTELFSLVRDELSANRFDEQGRIVEP